MIGIVAVSHSARLGEAALELALQMVRGGGAQVRVAAGAGTDAQGGPILGTDALAVASAIDELAAECEGVLVLMDLGSAVMSAELALELRSSDVPVRLAPAPFVEGLLAAVVSAAAGGSLEDVAAEAESALGAKTGQLAPPDSRSSSDGSDSSSDVARSLSDASTRSRSLSAGLRESKRPAVPEAPDTRTRLVRVRNPLGVHARPAALIAEASAGASVVLRRLPDGPEAPAASLMRLLAMGARHGDEIELSATGDGADAALDRLAALFDDGFGEGIEPQGAGTPEPPSATGASEPATGATEPATGATEPAPGAAEPHPPAASEIASDRASEATLAPAPETTLAPASVSPGTVLRGRGVSPGRAAARVVTLAPPLPEPDSAGELPPDARPAEAAAIDSAAAAVAERLRARSAAASGDARTILEAAALMASDPELVAEATGLVRTHGRTAARAVWEAAAAHERALTALGGRMAERAADIRDVRDRMIAQILHVELPGVPEREDPFVLVASDLAPADTAALEGSGCVALVTEQGGPTSHTAIIARSLGLPAVVGVTGATGIAAGETVLVDGDHGTIEVAPARSRVEEAQAATSVVAFDGAGRLADGSTLPLLANVGNAADAVAAAAANAEGVGLFRTEFCFLDREDAPSRAEQVAAYRGVLAAFGGRRVVVRTLDAGSDKPLPFANADREENPALGVRGLRVARRAPELLDTQLQALAEAAAAESALVEVMAPMVSTVEEARAFAERARGAGLARVGVMIETPSAALLARELLGVVDFVSLGTNDLAQYTLAADRMLSELGDLNDPWQPAVLRLIATVGSAGRESGRPVGVCGEAGADPALAPVLVGLGATSLSMGSRSLGRVAAALAAVTPEQCRRAADAVLAAPTADEARAAASAVLGEAYAP